MLELRNIYKTYRTKHGVTHRALNNVSLSFEETGLVFIVGKSGGGKSTLLNMIAALDKPDRGEILLWGNSFSSFRQSQYDAYRNTYIGVIFQEYNLIPALTVYQNISLSLGLQGHQSDERVKSVVELLGLGDITDRKPNQISGGQAQRVAIARAVVKDPRIIIADEPTGNLDSKTGEEMFRVFKELSKDKLVIVVTHDRDTADKIGDRIIEIKDGRVHKDLVHTSQIYENAIDVIGDRLVRVPDGQSFDSFSLEELNAVLGVSDRDAFIINESDVAKVKSMNIHVKNAVEVPAEPDSTYFLPYRSKPSQQQPLALIKAKMPLSASFKLSLTTFKYKTGRLVMTIISLVIALILSCAITVLSFYDIDRAFAKTLAKEDIETVLVKKDVEFEADAAYTADDIASLSGVSSVIFKVFSSELTPVYTDACAKYQNESSHSTLLSKFYGFTECDDITAIGYKMLSGSPTLQTNEDLIISSVAAAIIIEDGVFDISGEGNYEGLIGKRIQLSGKEFTISGVFDCDMKYYSSLKQEMNYYSYSGDSSLSWLDSYNPFISQLSSESGLAYVKTGAVEQLLYEKTSSTGYIGALGDSKAAFGNTTLANANSMGKVLYDDNEVSDSDVYLSLPCYMAIFGRDGLSVNSDGSLTEEALASVTEKLAEFNAGNNSCDIRQSGSDGLTAHRSLLYNDLHIKGIAYGSINAVYLSDADYRVFATDSMSADALIIKTPGTTSSNLNMIRKLAAADSSIQSYIADDYSSLQEIAGILKNVLTSLLTVTVIAASLLMFFFVSVSIKLESRQIGILRGMGARGFDTFKTFAIEGFLISAFSLLLSAIGVAVLFPIINKLISVNSLYSKFIFIINPYAAFAMILTAVCVTLLGVLIPMLRLITLTPINAINKGENQR